MKESIPHCARLRIIVRGAVQGVGFRPFVHRLANAFALDGWVRNSPQGVFIEVEGPPTDLERFLVGLEAEKPPRSSIHSLEPIWLDMVGYDGFQIRTSDAGGEPSTIVLPDIATCPDCLRDILNPSNRRYQYPFTNCTNCGPRFSIIESLPYDRANTSMNRFPMCDECRAEYEDPANRRFHAQPNACPKCGPWLELWRSGACRRADGPHSDECGYAARGHEALLATAKAIHNGQIVAVKGLGGFHLMCLASDDVAIRKLRERKSREEKPFAIMFPSVASVREECEVMPLEQRLLESPEAPIVLLRRWKQTEIPNLGSQIAQAVAPGNPCLGVMLPYTPLHYLLMREIGLPVVATSGNLSDEPICTDEREALRRLAGIADRFLVHNRPILRHVDDSIVRVMLNRELVIRRARGYAPLPVQLKSEIRNAKSEVALAVGAHLKNTVALAVGEQVFISQHIGDLETEQSSDAFQQVISDFQTLYDAKPEVIAADLHPDYFSTKYAGEKVARASSPAGSVLKCGRLVSPQAGGLRYIQIQHHEAHVLACMADNELRPPVLGVSWDGTGYGTDGTVWGGEFFLVTASGCERVGHLRPFRLPGGDTAIREPRRGALGLLHELYGEDIMERDDLPPIAAFSVTERAALAKMLERGLNSPLTSSCGRLFDAVASIIGLRQRIRFEGQAAMELEWALEGTDTDEAYPFLIVDAPQREPVLVARLGDTQHAKRIIDWAPLIEAILEDLQQGASFGVISAKFHNALAEAVIPVARRVGQINVVLSGGCFQNRYLTERVVYRLRAEGFRPFWHQRVPPNDGGIALGQVMAALRQCREPMDESMTAASFSVPRRQISAVALG